MIGGCGCVRVLFKGDTKGDTLAEMKCEQYKTWCIRNVRVLDPARGVDAVGDLFGAHGQIVDALPSGADPKTFDGTGKVVMPSLIDMHVHFREPGGEAAETLLSGSAAAFKGGVAVMMTMPNTSPPVDTPEAVRFQATAPLFASRGLRVIPSACCTVGRAGREPADLDALAEAGAGAFTDDGSMVDSDDVMEAVMRRAERLGKVVMEHAVVPSIAGDGVIRDCAAARQYGLPIFPPEAETAAVRRDIELCRRTGCALHIQHLSCGGSVDLIRDAQAEGLPVTAEVTPHHLMFAAEDIPGDDANWKMNPPLGNRADVATLRRGVLEGVIGAFATDHAPHTGELKAHGFAEAPFGVIGLETALAATWTALVDESGMAPLVWADRWLGGPARVLGIAVPTMAPGSASPATLFTPRPWTVSVTDIVSRSHNSPFIGRTLGAFVEQMLV